MATLASTNYPKRWGDAKNNRVLAQNSGSVSADWTYTIPGGGAAYFYSAPIILPNGNLAALGENSAGNNRVYVIDKDDGSEVLVIDISTEISTSPDGQQGSLLADSDGHIYVSGSASDKIAKYNGSTGALLWSFDHVADYGSAVNVGSALNMDSSGNIVVASGNSGYDGNLYKLNGSTGSKIWGVPTWGFTGVSSENDGNGINWNAPAIDGGYAYLTGTYNHVAKVDLSDGSVVWDYNFDASDNAFYFPSGVVVAGSRVYATKGDPPDPVELVCLNALSGAEIWTWTPNYPTSSKYNRWSFPAVDASDNVYVGDFWGNLYKLDNTGAQTWVREIGGGTPSILSPIICDDAVVVLGDNPAIIARINKSDGTVLSTTSVTGSPDAYRNDVVIGPNAMYVAAQDKLFAYTVSGGGGGGGGGSTIACRWSLMGVGQR